MIARGRIDAYDHCRIDHKIFKPLPPTVETKNNQENL